MRLVFLLVSVTSAMAAGTGQGFSGSFSSGNGQGFGYGGSSDSGSGSSFSSGGGIPQGFPPFDFNNLLDQYFQVFTKFNQDLATNKISAYSYSITNANSNNKAVAKSSITFDRKGLQNQQNAFAAGGYGFPGGYPAFAGGSYGGGGSSYSGSSSGGPSYGGGGYGSGFSSSGGQGSSGSGYPSYSSGGYGAGGSSYSGGPSYGSGGYGSGFSSSGGQGSSGSGYPSYSSGGYGGGFSNFGGQGAAASASIGPGGAHQTASVYPENPNIPNVNTGYGASPGGSSYGVFTSSQSSSNNGKSQHTAQTTINDNGKISTYSVHNP